MSFPSILTGINVHVGFLPLNVSSDNSMQKSDAVMGPSTFKNRILLSLSDLNLYSMTINRATVFILPSK